MRCSLDDLEAGASAVVVGYGGGGRAYRARLLSMGLTRGARVRVARRAPLGDPVQLELRGLSLSLRSEEARVLILDTGEAVAGGGE